MTSQGPQLQSDIRKWSMPRELPSLAAPQAAGSPPGSATWQRPSALLVLIHVIQEQTSEFPPSSPSQHSLIGILQTFLALFSSNSVRRHFNESELGPFSTEAGISIHSRVGSHKI